MLSHSRSIDICRLLIDLARAASQFIRYCVAGGICMGEQCCLFYG